MNGRIGGSNTVVSMREAAVYVGRSYKNFAASYKKWGIPCIRIGSRVSFRIRHLDDFLEKHTEK